MPVLNHIQKFTRAAVVAVALAGTTFAATVPVQAGSFEYSFSYGKGHHWKKGYDDKRYCLSDRQVRQLLRESGYRDIRFYDRSGRVVQVVAVKGKYRYAIAVDTCRGKIVDRKRIRW